MLSRAQLKAYEAAGRSSGDSNDARTTANHQRYNRSFVRVPYGIYTIKFYPLKNWPAILGVTNQTLRTWIKRHIITAYTMHRMYVMCRAELESLKRVLANHRMHKMRHTEVTPEMIADCMKALTDTRIALDTLKNPDLTLTEDQRLLLQPSLGDR